MPVGRFPKPDAYLDDIAKGAGKFKKIDGRGAKDMPAMMNARPGSGVVTNNIANGMLKDPGAVKVLISSWNNFNFSCTDPARWDKALSAVPFFVHMVTNASEMTQFADIVLPATFNTTEGMSVIANMGNLRGYATIQQPVGKRLWDVKQEETEVMWLLAEKLRQKGFPNLFDYFAKQFKDPETGKTPANEIEFAEIAAKISSAPLWMPKEPLKGDKIEGWADFRNKGMYGGATYSFKRGWGGKFATATKKSSSTARRSALELNQASLSGESYSVISFNPTEAEVQPQWSDTSVLIPGCTASGAETAKAAGATAPAMNQYGPGDVQPVRKAGIVEKCTFCYHRVSNGLQPACVEACPAKARIFGDQDDPKSEIAKVLKAKKSFRRKEEKRTKPNVHYVGTYTARA